MFDFLDVYPWLLPIIIFFGRILDVTLGTLRIIFVSKGQKYLAPVMGFFEVFIWVLIISQILSRANDLLAYLTYAAGYATGNYVGIIIEGRIAYGIIVCRIYTNKAPDTLMAMLAAQGYGATMFEGMGAKKKVWVVEAVVERKALKLIDRYIATFDENTFYTVEDVRVRQKGIFPKSALLLKRWRPGK
ncbi:MAG: DUF2179 domain-containing protein [Bacteroidales bacterium]|nr:DUF2179 domain-containing protein [Bacteroidales bacterium]